MFRKILKWLDDHPTYEGPLETYLLLDRLQTAILDSIDKEIISTMAEVREFSTGATRDTDADKPDYEGFLSPAVIERYGLYMNKHRQQSDGKLRDSDNWQKGIPKEAYMKSAWRHFFDWWKYHRGNGSRTDLLEEALCALMFNVMGYLHEHLKSKQGSIVFQYTPIPEEYFNTKKNYRSHNYPNEYLQKESY